MVSHFSFRTGLKSVLSVPSVAKILTYPPGRKYKAALTLSPIRSGAFDGAKVRIFGHGRHGEHGFQNDPPIVGTPQAIGFETQMNTNELK